MNYIGDLFKIEPLKNEIYIDHYIRFELKLGINDSKVISLIRGNNSNYEKI